MGNSSSGEYYNQNSSPEEVELPPDFGMYDDEGRTLTRKARKAFNGIRKIMEKKQPMEMWFSQLVRVSDHFEDKRVESIRKPDVQHATRLQRKLRSSPRMTSAKRSASAPERLMSLSRRPYYDKLDLQYSRTKSVLEIELANWFGPNVDSLAQRIYLKYLAIDPIVDDVLYPDDEEYQNSSDEHDSCCQCHCDHNNNDIEKSNGEIEMAKEKFIEDTVSHVLEFKKLIEDKAMNSRKKAERSAHAAKINNSVKNFIQLTTEHFMGRLDSDDEREKETAAAKKRLEEMREKILPYNGRESNRAFFNEVYNDFIKHADHCDCKFTTDGRGIENASLMEIAMHSHHHMQAVERVKELFIELLRESPSELKGCPIEMQIIYQSMARNLHGGKTLVIEKTVKKIDSYKSDYQKSDAKTYETPYIDIDEETFKQFPVEMQRAMENMIGGKRVGKVVIRQSITLNKQTLKKLGKK